MKLLLENWRKFLIERETDQIYSEIVDFLAVAFADKKNYDFLSDEEAESYGEEKIDFSDPKWQDLLSTFEKLPEPDPNEPRHRDYMLNEARIEDLYNELTKKIPDSRQIIDSSATFFDMLYGVTLLIEYDLENKGRGGYIGGGIVAVNFGSIFIKNPITVHQFNELSDEQIFEMLKNNTDMLKMVLEHEFTHMLNMARAGTEKTSKGLKRQHKKKSPERQSGIKYVNSTEEIQARLIPIFKLVYQALSELLPKDKSLPQNDIANIIALEVQNFRGNQSLQNIVKYLYKIYDLNHKEFLDHTSVANKKRISKRFYEFAQEIISQ
jgi:hypothetical protein